MRRIQGAHFSLGKDFNINKPVIDELDLRCPGCGRSPGVKCVAADGQPRSPHQPRLEIFRLVYGYQLEFGIVRLRSQTFAIVAPEKNTKLS